MDKNKGQAHIATSLGVELGRRDAARWLAKPPP